MVALLQDYIQDEQSLYDIKLALTEALSNIVLHAYQGKNKGYIRAKLVLDPHRLMRVVFIDQGKPFLEPEAGFSIAPPPQAQSGRGLYLITNLMDAFYSRHCKQHNILILEKNLKE